MVKPYLLSASLTLPVTLTPTYFLTLYIMLFLTLSLTMMAFRNDRHTEWRVDII